MLEHRFPRLRAVLRNAVTWGAAWAVAGGAVVATLGLFQSDPAIGSLAERVAYSALGGILWGVRFGLIGAVVGTAFAAMVRLGYRGRRLAEIRPWRFALLGAAVGGVGVPLFLQAMNVLTDGAPIAWRLVLDDVPFAALFGAVAAGGSILLARRADALPGGAQPEPLAGRSDRDALPEAGLDQAPLVQRSRVTQH